MAGPITDRHSIKHSYSLSPRFGFQEPSQRATVIAKARSAVALKYRCVDSAFVEASSTDGRDGEYLFSWPLGTTGSFPDFLSMRLTLAEHESPKRLKIWLLLVSITCFPLLVLTMNYQTLAIQFTCIYMLGTLEFRSNSSLSLFAATPFDDLKSLKLSTRIGLAPTHSHFYASLRAGMRTSSTCQVSPQPPSSEKP